VFHAAMGAIDGHAAGGFQRIGHPRPLGKLDHPGRVDGADDVHDQDHRCPGRREVAGCDRRTEGREGPGVAANQEQGDGDRAGEQDGERTQLGRARVEPGARTSQPLQPGGVHVRMVATDDRTGPAACGRLWMTRSAGQRGGHHRDADGARTGVGADDGADDRLETGSDLDGIVEC